MNIKNRLINAGILTAVFIAAVFVFSFITNRGNDNMTADMGVTTYPQVSFSCDGFNVNLLSGYAKKMDIPSMRDTITPVSGQSLDLNIEAYDNKINRLKYAVYTLDGKDKLFEKKVKKAGKNVSLELTGGELLSQERVLEIVLSLDGDRSVYFYTRIADSSNDNVAECLNYISDFHENALAKAEGTGVGAAIEPNEEGDNSTFQHVTIHSDYNQVTWGSLEPSVEGGERWYIKETNSTYTSVQLEYKVRCKGEENEEDVYKAKEFFRVRHIADAQKTYLLDYDRTMEQIFDPTRKVLSEKGVLLGITSHDVQYMVSKDGSIVSFVQADELWNYNKDTDELSLVFSFSDAENTDVRSLTAKHEVKLLASDDEGNVTFAVYGYMNRGEHEGEVGVAIYYYNIDQNSVEEKAFISSDKSYGTAVYELGRFVYYSVDKEMLYVMVDGTLYEVNVEKKGKETKEVIVKGLQEGQYVVSDDGHMIAYQSNGKLTEATEIQVINFANGKKRKVTCADGEVVRPLGFVKNDFVYGVARTSDTGKTVSGETVVPLYKTEIQNGKSKVIKTYEQKDIYVLEAEFDNNMITLSRVRKDGSTYTGIADDYITNNEEKEESNIYLESYVTELKETQYRLTYADGISDKEPKVLKPKQVLFENPTAITFDDVDAAAKCYVYGYGELQGIYEKAGAAIQKANEYNGVVISSRQSYIWERGNRDLQHAITGKDNEIQSVRERLNAGDAPIEIMNEISKDRGMDYTGCTAEQLLYVINQDIPVIAMLDASTSIILTGYTESTISYVDTAGGEKRNASYEGIDEMTQGSGHAYIGYIK